MIRKDDVCAPWQADPKLSKYFESDAYKLDVNNQMAGPYFF